MPGRSLPDSVIAFERVEIGQAMPDPVISHPSAIMLDEITISACILFGSNCKLFVKQ